MRMAPLHWETWPHRARANSAWPWTKLSSPGSIPVASVASPGFPTNFSERMDDLSNNEILQCYSNTHNNNIQFMDMVCMHYSFHLKFHEKFHLLCCFDALFAWRVDFHPPLTVFTVNVSNICQRWCVYSSFCSKHHLNGKHALRSTKGVCWLSSCTFRHDVPSFPNLTQTILNMSIPIDWWNMHNFPDLC